MRDWLITSILIVVMILNGIDVFVDIGLNVPLWHIIQESSLVLISGIGAVFLIFHIRRKSRRLKHLSSDLNQAKQQISSLNSKIDTEKKRYSQIIKEQFLEWKLTETEQEVAWLLLKGLSLKEVSVLRNTKEATVRQQASSIYSKSSLEGRHAFSAWFLEDLL